MGLFDIFKKKEQDSKQLTNAEPYLGDLAKTNEIANLVRIPFADRNEDWRKKFLSNLAAASFRCGNPQVITGPDGFPYFQLLLPEPYTSFQCYVIDKMKDDFLLEKGFGVVINPTAQQPDWALSYGDILNLYLNNEFYSNDSQFSKERADEVIQKEEKVLVGQPSENILPHTTRKLLKEFLSKNGIKSPKVLLMMRHIEGKGVSQDIAFNVTSNNFNNEATYRTVMGALAWYLPRHYSYVGLEEKTFENGFMPL